jgi:hypothetical protein
MRRDRVDRKPKELPSFPLLQMFGGLIGVLVVIVVLSAIKVQQVKKEQTKPENIVGIQKVELSSKPQIKLFLYHDYVLIDKTRQKVPVSLLMQPENPVTRYLRPQLNLINSGQVELFLLLYPNSNRTMFAMRQLFANVKAQRFNLLMLNKELIQQLLTTDSMP